jgi:hypothetical protein
MFTYPMPMNMGHAGFWVSIKANLHVPSILLAEWAVEKRHPFTPTLARRRERYGSPGTRYIDDPVERHVYARHGRELIGCLARLGWEVPCT